MRYYEMAVIARSEMTDDGHKELIAKVDGLLKKKRKKSEKGEILNVDDWGVRKLSYPIDKEPKGRYTFISIKCLPDTLSELERNIKLDDEVLRYQTIKLKSEPTFKEVKPEEEKSVDESKPEAEAPEEEKSAESAEV